LDLNLVRIFKFKQVDGVDKNNIFVKFDLLVEKNKQFELKKMCWTLSGNFVMVFVLCYTRRK
jgi:hypothetical protein